MKRSAISAPYDEARAEQALQTGKPSRMCRWCGEPAPKGRYKWCSQDCVDQYMITADSGYARQAVERRDHGICALCGLDTRAVAKSINRQIKRHREGDGDRLMSSIGISPARRTSQWRGGDRYPWAFNPWTIPRHKRIQMEQGREIIDGVKAGDLYDIDHIVPVCEGGGCCGLDNLRTLCLFCHKKETAKLAKRRTK